MPAAAPLPANIGHLAITGALNAIAVTKSDTVDLAEGCRGLWVGTGGDLKVTLRGMADDSFVTFKNVANATLLPIWAKRVWNSGAVADMLALY